MPVSIRAPTPCPWSTGIPLYETRHRLDPDPSRLRLRTARSLTKSQIRALIQHLNALALYNGAMTDLKRATVYFDPNLHKALRMKAAETDHSLSDLVNTAVRCSLAEDTEDLATFDLRAKEPNLAFENVLKDLTRRGKL